MNTRFVMEFCYQLRFGLPVWIMLILTAWLPDCGPATRLRGLLVSIWLPGRPRQLALGRDVTLLSVDRLDLGRNVYLAKGVWINAIGGVKIGNEVVCGPYVVMSSSNHGFKDDSVQRGGAHPSPISIGKGTWLASHVVVVAGVAVGPGNLVGANSVVTRSSPSNVKLAGVPSDVLGSRTNCPSSSISKHDFSLKRK